MIVQRRPGYGSIHGMCRDGATYEIFIKPSGLLSGRFAIVSARRHCTMALIALAAICFLAFLASLFFLYVLLQWMRETKRMTNALKKVASKRVLLPTARRGGAQRGQK
jgi:hypothetical protein